MQINRLFVLFDGLHLESFGAVQTLRPLFYLLLHFLKFLLLVETVHAVLLRLKRLFLDLETFFRFFDCLGSPLVKDDVNFLLFPDQLHVSPGLHLLHLRILLLSVEDVVGFGGMTRQTCRPS